MKPKTHTCHRCGNTYPFTPKYFHRNPRDKHGMHGLCKFCSRKAALKRYHERKQFGNRRLTALDKPRADIKKSLHNPDAIQVYDIIHPWICERQLTVGCHHTVTWCHIHQCEAELGTCELCADAAEKKLVEVSNMIAFNKAVESIRRAREAYRAQKQREREQRTYAGIRGFKKGPSISLPKTEAYDEFYWDLQETSA